MSTQIIPNNVISTNLVNFVEANFAGNWADFSRKIGVRASTLQNIKKGGGITAETIYRICNTTGASSDWLLTGKGTPFIGGYFDSEEKAINYLNELLDESSWDLYVFSDRVATYCLILTQTVTDKVGMPDERSYTNVEIIGGQVGRGLLGRIAQLGGESVFTVDAKTDEVESLVRGELGTNHIMGGGDYAEHLSERAIPLNRFQDLLDKDYLPDLQNGEAAPTKTRQNQEPSAELVFKVWATCLAYADSKNFEFAPNKLPGIVKSLCDVIQERDGKQEDKNNKKELDLTTFIDMLNKID